MLRRRRKGAFKLEMKEKWECFATLGKGESELINGSVLFLLLTSDTKKKESEHPTRNVDTQANIALLLLYSLLYKKVNSAIPSLPQPFASRCGREPRSSLHNPLGMHSATVSLHDFKLIMIRATEWKGSVSLYKDMESFLFPFFSKMEGRRSRRRREVTVLFPSGLCVTVGT